MEKKKPDFNKIMLITTYVYLVIPILLFFILWVKWFFAVLFTAFIGYGLFRLCKSEGFSYKVSFDKSTLKIFLISLGVIIVWVYLSGIGGFVYQNSDHYVRNEIFDILVDNEWPVVQSVEIEGVLTDRGLIYYIAFWLPAAIVGKIFGLSAGYFFQTLWAVIGIFLFYYLICVYLKKVSVAPLIIFIFFSGLDVLGTYAFAPTTQFLDRSSHIEWWSGFFQFSSFTTQLFWVFNQAMPLWIFIMLILLQENNRQIVFLMGLAVLYGPFPFVGLIPICLVAMFSRKYEHENGYKGWIKEFIKDTFTIENVLCGGAIGITSYLYFKGNSSAQVMGTSTQNVDVKGYFFMYSLFILFEAGVYFIATAKNSARDKYFYTSLISLLLIPLFKIGSGGDFCMRTSIPALVVLYLIVVKSLMDYKSKGDKIRFYALLALLLIGAATPFHEINRTVSETKNKYFNTGSISIDKIDENSVMTGSNFSGDIEGNFFYKWIAK